ncbi:MAG: hypothetical protein ACRDHP_11255, partial [Ktedonobacterales bacterium]
MAASIFWQLSFQVPDTTHFPPRFAPSTLEANAPVISTAPARRAAILGTGGAHDEIGGRAMRAKAVIQHHPVVTFFSLVFLIAYG